MIKHRRFSVLFVLCSLLSSAVAFAADGVTSDDIGALRYFTPEKKLYLSPSLTFPIKRNLTYFDDLSRGPAGSGKTTYADVAMVVRFGIMKNLLAELSMDYLVKRTDTFTAQNSSNSARTISKGWGNPTLAGNYRFVDTGMIDVRAQLGFSPSLFKTTVAGNSDIQGTHTGYWGAHRVDLAVPLFVSSGNSEFGVLPGARYYTSGKYESHLRNMLVGAKVVTSVTVDPFFVFNTELAFRHRISSFYAQGGVNVDFPYERIDTPNSTVLSFNGSTTTTNITNMSVTTKNPFVFTPKILLGFKVMDNTTIDATGWWQKVTYTSNTKVSNATTSATKYTLEEIAATLSVRHQI